MLLLSLDRYLLKASLSSSQLILLYLFLMYLYHFLNPCLCLPPLHVKSPLQPRPLLLCYVLFLKKLKSFPLSHLFILQQPHNLLFLSPSYQLEHKTIIVWITINWLWYIRKWWLLIISWNLTMFYCLLRSIYSVFFLLITDIKRLYWGLRGT